MAMFVIRNMSEEDIEMVSSVDNTVLGCRLAPVEASEVLKPGEEVISMAYEPGVSYTIRPVKDQHVPRRM